MKEQEILVSIVLEWENVLLAADSRCYQMLIELGKQISELDQPAEVIVLFNPEQIERAAIEPHIAKQFGASGSAVEIAVSLTEVMGKHYYDLKNEGARRARGAIVVFIDSDVIPEGDWLKELTTPLIEDPAVSVVAGHTYLTHNSFAQKAFALGWFFPLRNPANELAIGDQHFFANNVAFRRDIIRRHPFPAPAHGVTRGACRKLAAELEATGIRIWTNTAAKVHHPPPSSLNHYVLRGLAHGRDNVLSWKAGGSPPLVALGKSLRWTLQRTARAADGIATQFRRVDLPKWQVPPAVAVMAGFYGLALVGSLVTLLLPRFAEQHWRI